MSQDIIVKSINISESKKEVKKCNKVVRIYVSSLENVVDMGEETLIIAKNKIAQLSLEIKQLEEQNKNLECCGNCAVYVLEHGCGEMCPDECCPKWRFDNTTKEERKI